MPKSSRAAAAPVIQVSVFFCCSRKTLYRSVDYVWSSVDYFRPTIAIANIIDYM
jgi:hypothetical protein